MSLRCAIPEIFRSEHNEQIQQVLLMAFPDQEASKFCLLQASKQRARGSWMASSEVTLLAWRTSREVALSVYWVTNHLQVTSSLCCNRRHSAIFSLFNVVSTLGSQCTFCFWHRTVLTQAE